DAAATAAPLVTRHSIAEARRRTTRLLLAEDNRTNQMVALAMLRKLGYADVDLAENGEQAVAKVAAQPYDLILMDCLMPLMDGYEATRELRRRGVETPIIAVTANAMAGDEERSLASGMNAHLPKPLIMQTLAAALEKWLPGGGEELPLDGP
ncbi:MAG TPA: response regulator, partial [Rhodocyclaceae bacterium]